MKKYNYIYKIICLCGTFKNHYYIGKHTTNNLDDGYLGSGIRIREYFKKYGRKENETYIKKILEYNDTPEINAEREKEIIGSLWIDDPMCMNLMEGGKSSGMKGKKHSQEWIDKRRGQPAWNKGKKATEEAIKNQSIAHLGQKAWNKGIPMSEEQKEKLRESHLGKPSPKRKQVFQYDFDGNLIETWDSATEVQSIKGYSRANICNCCNGRLNDAYGYVWKYAS